MKQILMLTFGIFLVIGVFSQSEKVDQLIAEGVALHDQGKYRQAISKYETALRLDKNSTTANYEIAYAYFMLEEYSQAIKYGNIVLKQKADNQQEAYVVLGNSYDMLGKAAKAIKYYEEGLDSGGNFNKNILTVFLNVVNSELYNYY